MTTKMIDDLPQDDRRAAFERWASDCGLDLVRHIDGTYDCVRTDWAWEGYQAAQPSLLELRDKLVGNVDVVKHAWKEYGNHHPRGVGFNEGLDAAINIITSGFAPYVKGE